MYLGKIRTKGDIYKKDIFYLWHQIVFKICFTSRLHCRLKHCPPGRDGEMGLCLKHAGQVQWALIRGG